MTWTRLSTCTGYGRGDSGCGFEGDGVTEGFELADVIALAPVRVDARGVVVRSEVVEPGVRV